MADLHKNQPVPSPQPSAAVAAGVAHVQGTIFASAVRTAATYTSDEMFNANAKGIRLYIVRTVATGTLTVSIEGRDPVTDSWVAITGATTPALTSAINTTLTVYPGITVAAGTGTTSTEISNFLPCAWRVKAVVATDTTTWSIGGEYLL